MGNTLYDIIEDNPIIAGIKDDAGLKKVLITECRIVFILYGNIMTIGSIVKKIKDSGKVAFINVDLIEGFSSKEIIVQYLKQNTLVDGILSSKGPIVKAAKAQGLYAIHRFFLIDSFSYHNLSKQIELSHPDCIEILPGCMPKVISWVVDLVDIPVIAGGLVCEKDDVVAALNAGAKAISSTNSDVWFL